MAGTRPQHLAWGPIGLVLLGGALGCAGREGLSLVIPNLGEVPIVIVIVNVIGAFLLGYIYEALTRAEAGTAKKLKLLLGTGFCGGLTTYSSLATDTAVLFRNDHAGIAIVYALGTVVVGACATLLGIAIASAINRSQTPTTGSKATS